MATRLKLFYGEGRGAPPPQNRKKRMAALDSSAIAKPLERPWSQR
jgi:hypothetical protein